MRIREFKDDYEWQEFYKGLKPLAPTALYCINLGTGKVSEVDGDLSYYHNLAVKETFDAISAGEHDYCYEVEYIQNLLWLLENEKVNKPLKTRLLKNDGCIEVWI